MISIIICSRKSDISSILKENIQNTIGCDYELVIIDNSQNKHSIFTAYNEGVRRAKGDILCFMHDDILYHTNGWGPIIQKHFQEDAEIGLIGFAGAHFLPNAPMYWTDSPFVSEYFINNENNHIKECFHCPFYNQHGIAEVAVVDGLCFFVKHSTFNQIQFDDITYNGFHAYDMDICMHISSIGYKICVSKKILIEHIRLEPSENSMKIFHHNLEIFSTKWAQYLPISKGLNFMTQNIMDRINKQMYEAYDSRKVRNSKSYKLGYLILSIPKKIINLLKK